MMIEIFHTCIAQTAVNGALRAQDHTRVAILEPGNVGLLSIQTIDNEIILELRPMSIDVLIARLLRDETWIRSSDFVQIVIDENPHDNAEDEREIIAISSRIIDPREATGQGICDIDQQNDNYQIDGVWASLELSSTPEVSNAIPYLILA